MTLRRGRQWPRYCKAGRTAEPFGAFMRAVQCRCGAFQKARCEGSGFVCKSCGSFNPEALRKAPTASIG